MCFVWEIWCKKDISRRHNNWRRISKKIDLHGTKLRPDLIVHVPVESSHSSSRTENNFVVFAFKKQANKDRAKEDFEKLNELFEKLKYPLGIFININGRSEIFLNKYSGLFKKIIHEFCITQTNDKLDILHAYFQNDKVITEKVEWCRMWHRLLL